MKIYLDEYQVSVKFFNFSFSGVVGMHVEHRLPKNGKVEPRWKRKKKKIAVGKKKENKSPQKGIGCVGNSPILKGLKIVVQ